MGKILIEFLRIVITIAVGIAYLFGSIVISCALISWFFGSWGRNDD